MLMPSLPRSLLLHLISFLFNYNFKERSVLFFLPWVIILLVMKRTGKGF